MLKEALKIGISVVTNNHMYTFDVRIHGQDSGGSIGLELTKNIAQVFMQGRRTGYGQCGLHCTRFLAQNDLQGSKRKNIVHRFS